MNDLADDKQKWILQITERLDIPIEPGQPIPLEALMDAIVSRVEALERAFVKLSGVAEPLDG